MIDSRMTDALGRFLDVDVARYKLITSNLANIDTPGFRTRDLDFHAELARASVHAAASQWAANDGENFEPAAYAPVARRVPGLLERPDGNDVSVERESLLLADTQMKFNLGVQLLKDQFHQIAAAISSGGTSS
jgi:flagellar basal-body rod protein FlgB